MGASDKEAEIRLTQTRFTNAEQGGVLKAVFCLTVATVATVTIGWADVLDIKSERSTAAPEGTFPKLTASNLEKQTFSLPEDFAGDRNLLLIAFQRE